MRVVPGILMRRRRMAAVLVALGLAAVLATPADAAPADELRAALDSVRTTPHRATLTLRSVTVGDPEEGEEASPPFVAVTTVTQRVAQFRRSAGVVRGESFLSGPFLPSSVQRLAFTRIGDEMFMEAPPGLAAGAPMLLVERRHVGRVGALTDPGSAVRFPAADWIGDPTVVGESDGALRLRADLTNDAAIGAIFLLYSIGSEQDAALKAILAQATLGRHDVEFVVDRTTGRLSTSVMNIDLTVPLAAVFGDSAEKGNLTLTTTLGFAVGKPVGNMQIDRPKAFISLAALERMAARDQAAIQLLGQAKRALDSAHRRVGTYTLTPRELRLVAPTVKFVRQAPARTARRQVQIVASGTSFVVLRTVSATGKTYSLRGGRGTATRSCTLPGGRACPVP